MEPETQTYRIAAEGKSGTIALVVGVAGLALSVAGYFVDAGQFFHSYLTAYVFWLSIALGGLFFTMLHYLVGAKWSVVLRRLSENIMVVLPVMAILFLPLLGGLGQLYQWAHADAVATDDLLQGKSGYLNVSFFIIRLVGYFVIWTVLSRLLYRGSLQQDKRHDERIFKRMRRVSAPGMILFAITITFAAFDWLMSLDAHWYSTIFGVYVFSGGLLAMLSLMTLVAIHLRKNGPLNKAVTDEHYHDLGKLLFAFTIFWGYMAFSQYFLIWYANIPEETVWFLHRWDGVWRTVTLLIVFGHFVVPFFVLFPQGAKRNATVLRAVAIWVLIMHWVDLYWIVMPNLHHDVHLSWMDLTTVVGIGGIFLFVFRRYLAASPVVPVNDPGLEASIHFVSQ